MTRLPVLLDTDIGSNIDDALALAYLLRQPRCELLGVTTVTGEPDNRAMLADALCRAFGRTDVPILCGAANPMRGPQRQPTAPQAAVLADRPHRQTFVPDTAVDFLRRTIRGRPGRITLLTIGPLTNIGRLYAIDPEIPSLLRQHVLMAGHYFNRGTGYGPTEWNVSVDPEAAAAVFSAGIPVMRCIGLDVTARCRLSADEFRRRFREGPLRIIVDMAEVWLRDRRHVLFHDPLAAATVFDPSLCGYARGRVRIETRNPQTTGFTAFDAEARPPCHEVATDVDPNRFFEHYFATLAG